MRLNRVNTRIAQTRDLSVRETAGNQPQHVLLAGGQNDFRRFLRVGSFANPSLVTPRTLNQRRNHPLESRQKATRNHGGNGRGAIAHIQNCLGYIRWRRVFMYVAERPGLDAGQHIVFIAKHRNNQWLTRRIEPSCQANHIQAAAIRKTQVCQKNVHRIRFFVQPTASFFHRCHCGQQMQLTACRNAPGEELAGRQVIFNNQYTPHRTDAPSFWDWAPA